MSRRPTIADLARAAGVSVATVDRVLNGRHPVREETARRVSEAASGLGGPAVGYLNKPASQEGFQRAVDYVLAAWNAQSNRGAGGEA